MNYLPEQLKHLIFRKVHFQFHLIKKIRHKQLKKDLINQIELLVDFYLENLLMLALLIEFVP